MDENDLGNWSYEIGQLITSFALVEQYLYILLGKFEKDKLVEHAKNQRDFKDRARFSQALVRSSKWENCQEIEEILDEAIKFSTVRNQVAHNPLYLDISVCLESGDLKSGFSFAGAKSGKSLDHLNLKQLSKVQADLGKLSGRFLREIGKIGEDA